MHDTTEQSGFSLRVGETIPLTIHDLAFGGDGVGRFHDFVVFVPFVVRGEEVEVTITEIKKNFARAQLVRLLKPSDDRVSPPCPYFGACGGCQYQHIAYPLQLKLKHKQIADLFERIGKISRDLVSPVVPCPAPYGYRNRIMVRSQWDRRKPGLNIGFLRHDNRMVIDIEECKISEPRINEQLKDVRAHPPPRGGFKSVLRIVPEGWEVPVDSFFQNNFHLLPELLRIVRENLLASGARILIDAYCGVGFFSIELADAVEQYVGIELDSKAIKAARTNAQTKGRLNGEFLAGNTEEVLPRIIGKYLPDKTSILLDPPRTGCRPEVLELLREIRPKQVLYVSCHPATLARDLNILASGGVFELKQVTPLDMFPQTQHVECVADMRGRG
jgi:tRNA/tmRNA/rRNA uracil-C5-methylase (TrmA/RlmC/RlmD family)